MARLGEVRHRSDMSARDAARSGSRDVADAVGAAIRPADAPRKPKDKRVCACGGEAQTAVAPAAPGAEENLTFGDGRIIARAMSMSALADRLSGPIFKLGRPVVDMTGIDGAYDFTLRWATDTAPVDADAAPSLFTALEEQLGVRLETRELTVAVLVVDHAERVPSSN